MKEEMMTKEIAVKESELQEKSFNSLIKIALESKEVDPAKLQALLDVSERQMRIQAEIDFNVAMNDMQAKIGPIPKNGMIKFTDKNGVERNTPFAKYEDMMGVLKPLMIEHGFTLSFTSEAVDGILITGTLTHRGSHSIKASMRLPLDTSGSKNNLQAGGSTISYGRRYIVDMLFNIVREGEDNDGNGANISEEMVLEIQSKLNQGIDTKAFCKFMKVESVPDIATKDYGKAIRKLNEKLKELEKKK